MGTKNRFWISRRTIEDKKYPTISDVSYDTKIGKNMIVFHRGTTELFNERVHGGEIALKSWFGFKKYIHVNCAGKLTPSLLLKVSHPINLSNWEVCTIMAVLAPRKPTKRGNNIWRGSRTGDDYFAMILKSNSLARVHAHTFCGNHQLKRHIH